MTGLQCGTALVARDTCPDCQTRFAGVRRIGAPDTATEHGLAYVEIRQCSECGRVQMSGEAITANDTLELQDELAMLSELFTWAKRHAEI